MTTVSIRFDVNRARLLASEQGWNVHEWARRADTTYKTIMSFLNQDPRLKLTTVEQILKPLGIVAADIQLPRHKPCPAETVTK